jgi:hypothetical protein
MVPGWLTALAWASLATAFACAALILADVYARGYRQQMPVMEAVWPVTALYLGPLAVAAYIAFGRPKSARWLREHGVDAAPRQPWWATVGVGVSHCGAGCTIGDIVAEFAIFGLGATIAGMMLLAAYVADYILALALGIVFQYFAIAPMRGLGVREGLVEAAKADVLSLTAFEVGLFGWMAIYHLAIFGDAARPDSAAYWFLMQIGMALGFLTAVPVNVWLIRRGVKEAM